MKLTIELKLAEIRSCARVLNADAKGIGYNTCDGDRRDELLTLIVSKAALLFRLAYPEIEETVARDYAAYHRRKSRP